MTSAFKPPKLRHAFERRRVTAPEPGESMTHQSHTDACNIHNILARYDNVGVVAPKDPNSYVDCTALQGKSRCALIMEAREATHRAALAADEEAKKAHQARADKLKSDLEELNKLREQQKEALKSGD